MEITTVGIVGAGQMGNGIAHVAALAGLDVVLSDISQAQLDKARATVEKNLGRQVSKERLTADQADAALARLTLTTETAAVAPAHLVVEAATENVDLKYRIFEDLSRVAAPGAILASNTSSISITAIAAHTDRPDRVIGMHFMNPVPVMKLVEIIRGLATSPTPPGRRFERSWRSGWARPPSCRAGHARLHREPRAHALHQRGGLHPVRGHRERSRTSTRP